MARARKTAEDDVLNAQIGARMASLRAERGWSLRQLADRVGLSLTHVNALESGKHMFSASLLLKLSSLFEEPVTALLGTEAPPDELAREWRMFFDALPRRDRLVLLDLARNLTNWSETFVLQTTRRHRRHGGLLLSLEGIDGVLLEQLADAVVERLPPDAVGKLVSYDHGSELWQHMRMRFRDLSSSNSPALERTLLFACERLQRQEAAIRPALADEAVVLTPFFAMAPSVYQEADGIGDRRVIEIIETLLIQPDLVIVVYSDPEQAVRRTTLDVPRAGQFYSPYTQAEELQRALALHRKASEQFSWRGHTVHEIDLLQDPRLPEHAERLAARVATLLG
ncbi:helix-turn-helix domain-containing protein [Paraliomyxa miuraensis]|uniref:helix-turn-helix domain-containing protein n=1 Tax=Paraliomyxa miuraensis TaxID=376150 RepID=UPI00224D18C6|nr:helix-turn-helix domain-containing protein [Paraliomyxa miuraensis]MCX4241892.1 helix-turn-helix domain-containing protein [Paraliomyxa miuraensis]